MLILGFLSTGILFVYAYCLYKLRIGKKKEPETTPKHHRLGISLIIPFRNEANHLQALIESFENQDFSLENCSFIFVNDHSTDNSLDVLKPLLSNAKFDSAILHLPQHLTGKKQALLYGIKKAKHPIIGTCDADCTYASGWISAAHQMFLNSDADFLIGKVCLKIRSTFLHKLQYLEQELLWVLTRQTALLHLPVLCSGAHLFFKKDCFYDVGGYASHINTASGDDFFLLESFYTAKKKICVIINKDSFAETHGQNNWRSLLSQRMRWAHKTSKAQTQHLKLIGGGFFLLNVIHIFSVCASFFNPLLLLFVGLKVWIELFFIKKWMPITLGTIALFFVYPFYSMFVLCASMILPNHWKKRKV